MEGTELLEQVVAQDEKELEHLLQRHLQDLMSHHLSNSCLRSGTFCSITQSCKQSTESSLMPKVNELLVPNGIVWEPFDDFMNKVVKHYRGDRIAICQTRGHV